MKPVLLGYDAVGAPVRLSTEERQAHMHVIGSSGSGKSKFLEWLMRGDLQSGQGFCLIDPHGELYSDVLSYCAHRVARQEIILLDPSTSRQVVGFNPFRKVADAPVSVQVDRKIIATMHAWNVENADQTPTLERTLRLIYTILIELGVSLAQAHHLIDFNAGTVRGHLVDQLKSPLIRREWEELQVLRPREWRDEILSAKNRLFRFLTSPVLTRFMGISGPTLDLQQIMDQGKVLLVNLNPSDELSAENARVFGSLLVNEFFEAARRREKDRFGRPPKPYYLYVDEFQNFVSLDVADMLDQVRKRGLFLTISHQRFGHLSEDITDAVLTNCRIKAVFGGLPVQSARLMAEEMFINDLDPKRIKVAIYQTKFWPTYARDKVYTRGTSTTSAHGTGGMSGSGSFSSAGTASFFQPAEWFLGGPEQTGMSESRSSGGSSMSGQSWSDSEAYGESESVADIPILLPVPFEELSSIQFYTPEEQLLELTAALKEQFTRHCFIKIHGQQTQPLLVPMVKSFYTSQQNHTWYEDRLFNKHNALNVEEVDHLLETQESALLKAAERAAIEPAKSSAVELAPPDLVEEKPSLKTRRRTKPKPKSTVYDNVDLDQDKPDD